MTQATENDLSFGTSNTRRLSNIHWKGEQMN